MMYGSSNDTNNSVDEMANSSIDIKVMTKNTDKPSRSRTIGSFIAIWLDSNIDHMSEFTRNTIIKLRYIINSTETFTNTNECVDFLTDIIDEKVFMIISNCLGQQIVSLIENIPQLQSIYVLCNDKDKDQEWSKESKKVKKVSTQIELIFDALKRDVHLCEIDLISISIVPMTDSINIDELDQSFMYSQLLTDVIFKIVHNEKNTEEFVNFCRTEYAGNNKMLEIIDKFKQNYDLPSPIWWYAKESFIYSTLNKALRTQDIEIIIKMGFLVRDIHQQIQRLHSNMNQHTEMTLYRGQGISNVEYEKLRKSKGGLISFNNFLSTSIDPEVSLAFAESATENSDLTGVLFKMDINSSISSTPFALLDNDDISSYCETEKEVLFSMHSVFRIDDIKQIKDRLWQVNLTLTSDNDLQLKRLTDFMRNEMEYRSGWYRMGMLMIKMGEYDKAMHIYNRIIETANDGDEGEFTASLSMIYHNLGLIHRSRGDYSTALSYYNTRGKKRILDPRILWILVDPDGSWWILMDPGGS